MPSRTELTFEWAENLDAPIRSLGELAGRALYEEDRALHAAMTHGSSAENYRRFGRGLTYWLYETTLVYLVFRAWAPHHLVHWDYRKPNDRVERETPKPSHAPRDPKVGPIDLLVELGDGSEIAVEAKWCNTADWSPLEDDAAKLRDWLKPEPTQRRAFQLAFWWCCHPDELSQSGEPPGARVFRATFPTALANEESGASDKSGTFVMDLIRVT